MDRNRLVFFGWWYRGRQMLFGTLLFALALPYVIAWIPASNDPLQRFQISSTDIKDWVKEIDPSARVLKGGSLTHHDSDSKNMNYDFVLETKSAASDEVVAQIFHKINRQIKDGGWEVERRIGGDDQFEFFFTGKRSAYRVYVWEIPVSEDIAAMAKLNNSNVIRLKVLSIGYSTEYKKMRSR